MAGTSTVTAMIMSTIMTITTITTMTMNRGMVTIMLTRTGMLTS